MFTDKQVFLKVKKNQFHVKVDSNKQLEKRARLNASYETVWADAHTFLRPNNGKHVCKISYVCHVLVRALSCQTFRARRAHPYLVCQGPVRALQAQLRWHGVRIPRRGGGRCVRGKLYTRLAMLVKTVKPLYPEQDRRCLVV